MVFSIAGVAVSHAKPLLDPTIRQRALALLTELCAISSPSGDRTGLDAMARTVAAALGDLGLVTNITEELDGDGQRQPLLIARGPAAGDSCLLLVSHLDTVLAAAEPRLGSGRLEATGALDTKGGLAALVGALALLQARGQRPPADLTLVAVPDEEVDGVISERIMCTWGGRARTALVLQPGELRGDAESVVAGRRGMAEWRLEARGTASHSGLAYWQGRSALAATADWCARAQALSQAGPGITVNVGRMLGGDADFVANLGEHHTLLGSSRRLNVIPERGAAEGEARFLKAEDEALVLARLARLTDEVSAAHGVDMTFSVGARVAPVDPGGPGRPLIERAVTLAAERGWRLEVEEDRGGISFPNYLGEVRVAVVDGLGPVGGGMHTRDEFLDLRSLERRIVLLADLLATL